MRPNAMASTPPRTPTLSRAVAALCLVLGAAPLSGQSASVRVVVTGPDGPVANATVDVVFQDVVLNRGGTDDQGVVRIASLPLGTFDVRVEALGYRPVLVEDVRLGLEERILAVELLYAPIAVEGVTVRAPRIQIQRENTEFGSQVDAQAISLLPVTHDATDLVALTPGARPGHVWGGASFQANNYRIDGLSANHPGLGGDLLQPSVNWIDRVEVRGLGAGAEYGGFQGGIIDVVTKRGTNLFQGAFRTTFEHDFLGASNLVSTEIGREVTHRIDVEGEARGPIVEDRLYYYVSGKRVAQDSRALNHLRWLESAHTPFDEERSESKLFGKLTWTPTPGRMLEVSGAYTDVRADNWEITGYEGAGASHEYSSPTWFLNASVTEILGDWGSVTGRVNHFSRDERYDPYQGEAVPGIRTFSLTPPYNAFGNAPFTLRSAPSSTSGMLQGAFRTRTGGLEHTLRVGAEYGRGSFLDRRIRNGGMTWLPVNANRFDPDDPSTWGHVSSGRIASGWGGEVHLDADVSNAAAYAQGSLSLGPRVVVSPGVRWSQWTGWITPRSGDRFQAVEDQGWDPRVGVSVDLTGSGDFVAKAHWGRYHQSLISQMFDRVEGADVFTNEEYWYYRGPDFSDPTHTFTEAERDALARDNGFVQFGEVILNETGPVRDYSQPYVDQWLVGLEKQISWFMKVEALYTRRSNRDMVALVDLNRGSNYTRFRDVRVFLPDGSIAPYSGGSIFLPELWVPNDVLRQRLRDLANDGTCCLTVPGMTPADTVNLTWNPDYVLTRAPDGRREFQQVQVNMELALPEWGASLSVVRTSLEGNLDNVSGYTDPEGFGAGPYVRVNEGVNSYGDLENSSELEWKASVWGVLPGELRGGAFYTYRSGDHYSPRFRLYGLGFFRYKVGTGALQKGGTTTSPGQELDYALLYPLEGHNIFVGPRGLPKLDSRANLDLRVERTFDYGGRELAVSVDVFNLFGSEAITQLNTMVNNGPDYGYRVQYTPLHPGVEPNQYYKAPQERVRPRTFRLGIAAYF